MGGDLNAAIGELRETLRIYPGHSKVYHHLGVALEQKRLLREYGK